MRDAVAGGRIDRIYVLAPDRLARRYAYQVLLVEEFRRAGTEVVFLNRAIGDSAEDDLLLQVQGVIAEYERAKVLERGRRGRRHAAKSGAVSALSGAPIGYRYIGRHAGGGIARFERCEDEARIVRSIFTWVGVDRINLREVCRRLQKMGCSTKTGRTRWDPTTVCEMLRNPVYRGMAMFGRTRSMPAKPRLRPIGRRTQAPKRASGLRSSTPREEWTAISVPALVDEAQFEAAQLQLDENRKRKREGRRRPGWLLQGLIVCRRCGYAFYGKMARGIIGGRQPADYGYYRCAGTDAHRLYALPPGPTGVTMSMTRRIALLEWARDANAWLVEDDYDSEFRYAGPPLTALGGIDEHARVIYLGTVSKTLFPGLRIGVAVLPQSVLDPIAPLSSVGGKRSVRMRALMRTGCSASRFPTGVCTSLPCCHPDCYLTRRARFARRPGWRDGFCRTLGWR